MNMLLPSLLFLMPTFAELPKAKGPLSPKEELATFKLPEGFKAELVAAEPDVVDPVAMCFDEKGRIFVCEMRGYPNGGVGTGKETRGQIKCLEDRNGDGVFEIAHTFADGLRFPMGITPYKNGMIVAVAPDILLLEDTNGDGKADKSTILYTGFHLANIQQMVNSLQWGHDNWIYGIAGSVAGTITSPQRPDFAPLALRNRGFRFRPDVPGSMEPISSGGQYGLASDDYQRWFTATNSQHLRQIVLPDHYLQRNPYLAVSAVTLDIPEHGAAAKVFRVSPFEPWRVERTTRRAGSPDAKRFPATELVPGGYITSACSPLIYTADLFGKDYYGNNFVCDPANNLIHRELLKENGAVFRAVRAYEDREFLASTDNWFRPVHLCMGPDSAIYVLDFYREAIETPLSLPEDIKAQLNLESRGRGRIWRITPTEFQPTKLPDLSKQTNAQLADELVSANPWRRIYAQRLLVQREAKNAAPTIRELLAKNEGQPSRVNVLWALHGIGELKADDVLLALKDPNAGVREMGLRLAEPLVNDAAIALAISKLVDDPTPRVRFQLAFTAGLLPVELASPVLVKILQQDASDSWTVTAALSSAREGASQVLAGLSASDKPPLAVLRRLAAIVGASGNELAIARVIQTIADGKGTTGVDAALLDGLGQGMQNSKRPLNAWLAMPPKDSANIVATLRMRFEQAAQFVADAKKPLDQRLASAALLTYAPFDLAGSTLSELLSPTSTSELQLAAIRALAAHADPKVAGHLLKGWKTYSPATRALVLDTLLARPDRTLALIAAVESKQVAASDVSPAQAQQLKSHPNAAVKKRAGEVFKQTIDADRAKVVAAYTSALQLKGDTKAGKAVFAKNCAACHKLDGVGNDVGANLLATLGNKSGEDLLTAVFDPNREVDPRYLTYQVGTADGRVLTGIVASESATSITIRRAEGTEDVILRTNLDTLRATTLSLMPVGLEKELKPQDVADLFAYLRIAGK